MKFRRERQAKWDRRHLVTVSTHLTEAQYLTLRAICTIKRITPYEICRKALLDFISGASGNPDIDLLTSGIMEDEPERPVGTYPELFPVYDPGTFYIRHD